MRLDTGGKIWIPFKFHKPFRENPDIFPGIFIMEEDGTRTFSSCFTPEKCRAGTGKVFEKQIAGRTIDISGKNPVRIPVNIHLHHFFYGNFDFYLSR
jgi:hypothetical protein